MNAIISSSPARYTGLQVALGVLVAGFSLVLMGIQPVLVGFYSDYLHLNLSQSGWVHFSCSSAYIQSGVSSIVSVGAMT